MTDWEKELQVLSALLNGIVPRCGALAREPDDAELGRLAADLEAAARFVIEADSYQRPDQYCFASSPLAAAEVATFLERLFARRPEARAGYLARLAAFHRV